MRLTKLHLMFVGCVGSVKTICYSDKNISLSIYIIYNFDNGNILDRKNVLR